MYVYPSWKRFKGTRLRTCSGIVTISLASLSDCQSRGHLLVVFQSGEQQWQVDTNSAIFFDPFLAPLRRTDDVERVHHVVAYEADRVPPTVLIHRLPERGQYGRIIATLLQQNLTDVGFVQQPHYPAT